MSTAWIERCAQVVDKRRCVRKNAQSCDDSVTPQIGFPDVQDTSITSSLASYPLKPSPVILFT